MYFYMYWSGKTVTLLEAIKLIVKTQASCNILACAPSNSATDHLCEKILESNISKGRVFRLYALTFPVRNIPRSIKVCNFYFWLSTNAEIRINTMHMFG